MFLLKDTTHNNCQLLTGLYFGDLYGKQYGPRSDCSLGKVGDQLSCTGTQHRVSGEADQTAPFPFPCNKAKFSLAETLLGILMEQCQQALRL